jgi:hypothetical protein
MSTSSKGAWNKAPAISSHSTAVTSTTPSDASPAPVPSDSPGHSMIAGLAAALTLTSSPSLDVYSRIFITGNLISLILPSGESLSGVVFCYEQALAQVAIELGDNGSRNFALVNTRTVSDVKLIRSNHCQPQKLPEISREKLNTKEEKAIMERQKEARKLGKSVSAEGQRVFDAISRVYDCEWAGEEIVVLDSIHVAPPYQGASVKGQNQKQVERIRKMVEAERSKMAAK